MVAGSAGPSTDGDGEAPQPSTTRLSRSPHPYHRRGSSLSEANPSIREFRNHHDEILENLKEDRRHRPNGNVWKRRRRGEATTSSGSEADDEKGGTLLSLPPAPIRPRKGLKDASGSASPLLTPTCLDNEREKSALEAQARRRAEIHKQNVDEAAAILRKKFQRRRRAEFVRRVTETLLFAAVCSSALGEDFFAILKEQNSKASHVDSAPLHWRMWDRSQPISTLLLTTAILYAVYPLRIILHNYGLNASSGRSRFYIHIPAAFDPAQLLYPVGLPAVVAITLTDAKSNLCLFNVVLGLASLPRKVIPFGNLPWYHSPQWLCTLIPGVFIEKLDSGINHADRRMVSSYFQIDHLPYVYPLHMTLLTTLYYLTTTSLLPAELHLLSVSLINLLIVASSPQATILQTILWLGGIFMFLFCTKAMKWEVALARIPRWRFRKNISHHHSGHSRNRSFGLSSILARPLKDSSSSDELEDAKETNEKFHTSRPTTAKQASENGKASQISPHNNTSRKLTIDLPEETVGKQEDINDGLPQSQAGRRSTPRSWTFRRLTDSQALVLRWLLALYVYVAALLAVFFVLRPHIAKMALRGQDPFPWALEYLFGDLPYLSSAANHSRRNIGHLVFASPGFAEHIRGVVGPANTRLLICAYCLCVIAGGLLTVLSLHSMVEVDTRRKVFHGMMVTMFLPTIFVDPCFISLALIIILALFLLTDLFRAAQLPPIAAPLTKFLSPYVDGRDYRGPVIVSHLFLLIGCAIPLWLSLAPLGLSDTDQWRGWEVKTRDLSMVSGVVCVGMGDAAASLIGRRYGRRRWCWTGGKSLEGSTSFVVAVVIGLTFAKGWLLIGGWQCDHDNSPFDFIVKATMAACGASLTEAVLTGGNDNVIVPIILWLLVQNLKL